MKKIRRNRAAAIRTTPSPILPTGTIAPQIQADPAIAFQQITALPSAYRPDPANVAALQRTVGNQAVSQLLAQRAIQVQRYPVTGEWLKSMFGYTHINECRQAIGELAFQSFLKLQTEQLSLLEGFFKAQTKPIANVQGQSDLLVPLVSAPERLNLMKDTLTKNQYDPTTASPIYNILAPLVALPEELTLMREALTLTNNNPTTAPAIKDYLLKYQNIDPKVPAAARRILKDKGNDPIVADRVMIETKDYNYHESVKNQVEALGNQKATDEYDVAVKENKEEREEYLTTFTDTSGVDLTQENDILAETLSEKRATTEHATNLAKNTTDRESFITGFLEKTGYAHTTTFTRKQMEKPLQHAKLHTGLKFFFGNQEFTVQGVKNLVAKKLKGFDDQEIALPQKLPLAKTTYEQEVTKKLGEFTAKQGLLDVGLEPNKTQYKDALRLAITPLFNFTESEAAAEWVLTTAGADEKLATTWVSWLVNGLNAKLALTDLKHIFKVFTLPQLEGFHIPTGGTDATAQALLRLLKIAKTGEAAKFTTLIERDQGKDFSELLTFITKANGDIDRALAIFSKKDVSKDVNTLLGELTTPTIADPLQEGQDYLKHKGKAADVSFLLAKSVPKVDAELLLAKKWVVGHGEEVAHIYDKSGNNVTRTIAVLDILKNATKPKTPVDVKEWLDYNHTFANIYNKLQADNDQQFWAGEICAENSVPVINRTGQVDDVNTVIATSTGGKTVGEFYSGGGFGNLGNGAGQPKVMVLPDNTGYREYDIKPYKDDPGRGKRRIVVGGGKYYYTSDHYVTFERFRP